MRSSRGFTLAELLIATALLAIVVVGVFSSLYAAAAGASRGDLRQQAALYVRQIDEELKDYVTADTSVTLGAPGSPPWHLPGDACGGCAGGAGCWALREGCTHDVTSRLPAEYQNRYRMRLVYNVSVEDAAGLPVRRARIEAEWDATE